MLGWRLDSFGDLPSHLQDSIVSGRCCWLRTAARISQCVFVNSSLLLASPSLPPSWWSVVRFPKSFWLFDFQVQGKILLPGPQVVEWLAVGPEDSSGQWDVSGGEVCHHKVKPVMAGVRMSFLSHMAGSMWGRGSGVGKMPFFSVRFWWCLLPQHKLACSMCAPITSLPSSWLSRDSPIAIIESYGLCPDPTGWETIEIDLNLMLHDWHKMLIYNYHLIF